MFKAIFFILVTLASGWSVIVGLIIVGVVVAPANFPELFAWS